jgi:hypothetical protein
MMCICGRSNADVLVMFSLLAAKSELVEVFVLTFLDILNIRGVNDGQKLLNSCERSVAITPEEYGVMFYYLLIVVIFFMSA